MSILGLHCGRRMGNSEILLKDPLMGAEEISGAEVEIIRLMDLTIKPCTGCEACTKKRSRGEEMECVVKGDHMSFLLEKLLQCDALDSEHPGLYPHSSGFLEDDHGPGIPPCMGSAQTQSRRVNMRRRDRLGQLGPSPCESLPSAQDQDCRPATGDLFGGTRSGRSGGSGNTKRKEIGPQSRRGNGHPH